jgi:hypothetical protein
MAEDLDTRYRRLLAKQLAMNEETWRVLQSHGITEGSELRLDFTYRAPSRAKAEVLRGVLSDETDYAVSIKSDGGVFNKRWSVVGSTQPTSLSSTILDQWVDWMVTAGLHQDCEFDGWGTEV